MDRALGRLVDLIDNRLSGPPLHVVGIGGAVAVGKSTVAVELAAAFADRGRRPVVVATDAFLFANSELAARDLLYRKGFPESYDWDAMRAFLDAVRTGTGYVEIPVYSHTVYDIVAGEKTAVTGFDLVFLEGVVALQPRIADLLHATIYIDADETAVKTWFADRFVRLTDEARDGAESFYRMFTQRTAAEVRAVAEGTWDAINGPNLHDHISKTRDVADLVVTKRSDHAIEEIRQA